MRQGNQCTVYDNMMLDLLVSSKSALNCHNKIGNRKKKSFCKNCCMERRPTAQ